LAAGIGLSTGIILIKNKIQAHFGS